MSDSFATPWTVAHKASLSIEFSRQEYWVAISFSKASSQPRDRTQVSCIGRWILYYWATGQALLSWYMNPYEKCCLSLTKELELLAVGRKVGTSSKLLWLNDENSIFWFWNGQRLSGDQATKRPGMCKYSLSDVFPGGSDSKASACNVGDPGSIPGSGRSPGEGNDTPLQYSCRENPMDGGAWWVQSTGLQRIGHNWAISLYLSIVTQLSPSLHFHAVKMGQQLKYREECGVLCVMDRFLPWSLILRLFWGSIWTNPIIRDILKLSAAAAAAKSLQSCPTLRDPMDYSLPGSSVHGIF